jgi:gamma-glutamyl:cysteine ligase YbdK (ATP-grasp superfamily)
VRRVRLQQILQNKTRASRLGHDTVLTDERGGAKRAR